MELFEAFGEVSWLAVVLAALSNFAVGYVWYHQRVFGARWAALAGVRTDGDPGGMGAQFGILAVVALASAATLNALMLATDAHGVGEGVLLAGVLALVLRAGAHFIHNGFAQRPVALSVLDGAHDVLAAMLMGALLGLWV
ncbi:hypothetical protein GCM10010123_34750 [Pilimelia anulata]|uniref:DUF1761 domain-containing protein n=1 Tax=Pilimelia anulata TaxID=53371 RepID=A0A8J3FEU0_9ACTN|nr:DUF1761 domain-containing protein [Pilimelia anulata]GGK01868.1 hypothetical protein GCM10010123_34750 [Pilimelia anulata]